MKTIICKDINGSEEKVPVEKFSFRPSVYGVVIKDNKILLVKQWDGYDFPGGGVEMNETLEQALVREFKEETGLDVKVKEVVLAESNFFKSRNGDCWNSILIYFSCEIVGGEITDKYFSKDEKNYAGLAEWIDISEVNKIKFYNSIDSLKIIKKAIAPDKHLAEVGGKLF